jgi:hypothetical protein
VAVLEEAGAVRSVLPPLHKQPGAVGYRIDSELDVGWDTSTESAEDISPR